MCTSSVMSLLYEVRHLSQASTQSSNRSAPGNVQIHQQDTVWQQELPHLYIDKFR